MSKAILFIVATLISSAAFASQFECTQIDNDFLTIYVDTHAGTITTFDAYGELRNTLNGLEESTQSSDSSYTTFLTDPASSTEVLRIEESKNGSSIKGLVYSEVELNCHKLHQ